MCVKAFSELYNCKGSYSLNCLKLRRQTLQWKWKGWFVNVFCTVTLFWASVPLSDKLSIWIKWPLRFPSNLYSYLIFGFNFFILTFIIFSFKKKKKTRWLLARSFIRSFSKYWNTCVLGWGCRPPLIWLSILEDMSNRLRLSFKIIQAWATIFLLLS